MICRACRKELNFPDLVLVQLTFCPYCKAPFHMDPENIEEAFTWFLEDNGLDILSKENEARYEKMIEVSAVSKFPESNMIELLRLVGVMQRIYNVRNASPEDIAAEVRSCFRYLTDFHIDSRFAWRPLIILIKAMRLNVNDCFKLREFGTVQLALLDGQSSWSSWSGRERDDLPKCDIPTCKIGRQIWFAKNFDQSIYGTPSKEAINPEKGKLFRKYESFNPSGSAYIRVLEKGWRLPTQEDFNVLANYVKSFGMSVGEALKSDTLWKDVGKGGGDYWGFDACPMERNENGSVRIAFWLSERDYYGRVNLSNKCAVLSGEDDEIHFEPASDDVYACVRYVRDVVDN